MVCPVAKLTPVAERPICQGTVRSLPLVGRVIEDPKMNDMVSGKPNSMGAPLINPHVGWIKKKRGASSEYRSRCVAANAKEVERCSAAQKELVPVHVSNKSKIIAAPSIWHQEDLVRK